MNGIHPEDLLRFIIRPTLAYLQMSFPRPINTKIADFLLLGTAAQESDMGHRLDQIDKYDKVGPAVSPWQIEKATHDDIRKRIIGPNPGLTFAINKLMGEGPSDTFGNMAGNLYYACAIARLKYWSIPAALPTELTPEALGLYWKEWYNTPAGAGTVAQFVANWKQHKIGELL